MLRQMIVGPVMLILTIATPGSAQARTSPADSALARSIMLVKRRLQL